MIKGSLKITQYELKVFPPLCVYMHRRLTCNFACNESAGRAYFCICVQQYWFKQVKKNTMQTTS